MVNLHYVNLALYVVLVKEKSLLMSRSYVFSIFALQFYFVNCFYSLFYIAFYLQDIDLLQRVRKYIFFVDDSEIVGKYPSAPSEESNLYDLSITKPLTRAIN